MIVYPCCGNNNTADSVFNLFTEAVETFGCPLRVRADRGTENTKVADYMIAQGGSQNSQEKLPIYTVSDNALSGTVQASVPVYLRYP